jgi:hypothetical protein
MRDIDDKKEENGTAQDVLNTTREEELQHVNKQHDNIHSIGRSTHQFGQI